MRNSNVSRNLRGRDGGGDQRSDLLATHRPGNVARSEKVKNLDGNFSFHAHRECGEIHHPKLLFDRVFKRQRVVPDGIVVFGGISVVDAINFGGFQQPVSAQFRGSKGCTGVGGEEGVAGPSREDQDSTFFKVSNRAISDERLGDRRNGQGAHQS